MSVAPKKKNLPGITKGRMGRLQRRVNKLQERSDAQQLLLQGLLRQFQQFEKYQSLRSVITAIDRVVAAIHELSSGGDGVTGKMSATVDRIATGVKENKDRLAQGSKAKGRRQ